MSRKGHYPGGSTVLYGPKPQTRVKPKTLGALDIWISDAVDMNIKVPEDIRLKPVQRFLKKAPATKKKSRKKRKKATAAVNQDKGQFSAVRFRKLKPNARAKMFEKFVEQMRHHTQPERSSFQPNPQDDVNDIEK